ncbi:MAG: InlB B-repeat-containing protein [Lachnospiraceae bacterium]|nr:InlB B-repeat-containing protein [Lachnospiraceae bacterium]
MKSKGVIMEKMPAGILHRVKAIPVLFFMIMFLFGVFTKDVRADFRIWHEVNLEPGQEYDCSSAGTNTTVFIKKAGTYRLKGKSEKVRVVIQSDGAVVRLADGLNLKCGIKSYDGSRTAPIWVDEFDGTAKIISEAHANIYLEGYMCPAIRKEGTQSQLVFETVDPDDPGTINCQAGTSSPGIGGVFYLTGSNTLGNITVNSGNIIAKGKGAGIGGGDNCSFSNFTVNGGSVEAYGGDNSAAIGGGKNGSASGIIINGGRIHAECGEKDKKGSYTDHGSAIGAGADGRVDNFHINGGDIVAINRGYGTAIGGKNVDDMTITGGIVNALNMGGGPGIGASDGFLHLFITGGYITAEGGPIDYYPKKMSPGIGTGATAIMECHINISGGTINTKAGYNTDYGIGAKDAGFVHITGGSVLADKVGGTLTNDNGLHLHRVDVTLEGVGDDVPVLSMECLPNWFNYGLNDVVTGDGGKLYLWLATDNNENYVRAVWIREKGKEKCLYGGNIPFNENSGVLKKGAKITLKPKTPEAGGDGLAYVLKGDTDLRFANDPQLPDKTVITSFFTENDNCIAGDAGNLMGDVEGLTDANGKWISDKNEETIYFASRKYRYSIEFDDNKPRDASTNIVDGEDTQSMEVEYDAKEKLSDNRWVLPGYEFIGWNTQADGYGTGYADKAYIRNLSDKDGGKVMLYAQWRAKEYSIALVSESSNGPYNSSFVYRFDSSGKLPTIAQLQSLGFNPPNNKKFQGWDETASGTYYADGGDFVNLCSIPSGNENPEGKTLNAEWIGDGSLSVSVIVDGQLKDVTDTMKITKTDDQNTSYTLDDSHNGRYSLNLTGIIEGDYMLSTENDDYAVPQSKRTINNLKTDSSVSLILEYHTVSIACDPADDNIMSAILSEEGLSSPVSSICVEDDARVVLQTNMKKDSGYHFDGYSVLGIMPGNAINTEEMDLSTAYQAITVRGKATITAHAVPNAYTVKYDKNGGSYIEGEMEDQDMVYTKARNLFANKFTCAGATFAGWNTKKDGSGTAYTDGQSVKNLTAEDGGVVTLYAQWTMDEYGIAYDLNGGRLPAGKTNPVKYSAADAFTLVNPEKADYDFIGWTGTGIIAPAQTVKVSEGSVGKRRYYALFSLKIFNVRFENNGGTGSEPLRVVVHGKAAKPDDPTRDGYDFMGWFADAGLKTPFDFNREITADTVIYAGWKSKQSFEPSLKLNKSKLLIQKKKSKKLTAAFTNVDDKSVTWTTSKKSVVTISGSGLTVKLKGKKKGTSVITATSKDGKLKATCKVTVREAGQMPKLSVGKTSLNLAPGGKKAKVSLRVAHDSVKSVVSSNESVAKVKYNKKKSRMEITPGNIEGKATITVTTGWDLKKTVKVKVKMPNKKKKH